MRSQGLEYWVDSWRRMWQAIGAQGDGIGAFGGVVARYSESQRKYHTCQHLLECLTMLDAAVPLCARWGEVAAAIWFHDAIYDLGARDNEQRSADLACSVVGTAGVGDDATARVRALIMATTHAGMPPAGDAQVVVDVDLAILGAAPERFIESEAQIRDEHAFLAEDAYRARRRKTLEAFLSRPSIYSTAQFQSLLEAPAQRNLSRSLEQLNRSGHV